MTAGRTDHTKFAQGEKPMTFEEEMQHACDIAFDNFFHKEKYDRLEHLTVGRDLWRMIWTKAVQAVQDHHFDEDRHALEEAGPEHSATADLRAGIDGAAGQCPGHGLPDWPRSATTYEARMLYQLGIAHARVIAAHEAHAAAGKSIADRVVEHSEQIDRDVAAQHSALRTDLKRIDELVHITRLYRDFLQRHPHMKGASRTAWLEEVGLLPLAVSQERGGMHWLVIAGVEASCYLSDDIAKIKAAQINDRIAAKTAHSVREHTVGIASALDGEHLVVLTQEDINYAGGLWKAYNDAHLDAQVSWRDYRLAYAKVRPNLPDHIKITDIDFSKDPRNPTVTVAPVDEADDDSKKV